MDDGELAAVVSALAGVRMSDRVAVLGVGPLVARAVQAMTTEPVAPDGPVRVAVAGKAFEVPGALARLEPGGRLVAVAADAAAARRTAEAHGLELRHVVAVGRQVAWSAVRPGSP